MPLITFVILGTSNHLESEGRGTTLPPTRSSVDITEEEGRNLVCTRVCVSVGRESEFSTLSKALISTSIYSNYFIPIVSETKGMK